MKEDNKKGCIEFPIDPSGVDPFDEEYKYKYIYMKVVQKKAKTNVWNIFNNKSHDVLGGIAWYGPWRQYCFYAKEGAVFNAGCLEDIQHFIEKIMAERK